MTSATAPTDLPAHSDAQNPSPIWLWAGWATIALAGLVVRFLASRGDVWLDEVLSLNLARSLDSPLKLLTDATARSDNNHPFNTLLLWFMRATDEPWLLRLPSVLSGTTSIILAGAFAQRWGRASSVFAAVIMAGSFVMVHYASEARGYAMLVCFSLLAINALDRALTRRSMPAAVLFWIGCGLAMFAHVLFLHAFAGMLAWTAWRLIREPRPGEDWLTRITWITRCHGVPLVLLAVYYRVFARHLVILGAETSPPFTIITQAVGHVLGIPQNSAWTTWAAAFVLVIMILATIVLWRRRDRSWVLLLVMCVLAPGTMIVLLPDGGFVLTRYFMLPITGWLLMLALVLGRLFMRGPIGKIIALIVLSGYLVGNIASTRLLLIYGRGQYRQALADVVTVTPHDPVYVGGDHQFRTQVMVDYIARFMPKGRIVGFVLNDQWGVTPPDWVFLHRFDPETSPPEPRAADDYGHLYEFVADYPTGPLSGWYWYTYKRVH